MTNTSTLPVYSSTLLHFSRYSVWRTLRLWILVIILLLMTSNGLWPPHSSPNLNHFVPLDQTTVIIPPHQVDQRVVLIYQNNADGTLIRVLAHPDQYSEFVHQQVAKLEVARLQLREQVKVQFTHDLNIIFDEVRHRIPLFSGWYFSYSTNYDLFLTALRSALSNLGEDHFNERVSREVESVIQHHYERIVLKPEILNAKIEWLCAETVQNAHTAYLSVIAEFESAFQQFLAQHTTHWERDDGVRPEIRLDFVSQIRKLRMTPMPEVTVLRSVIFTTMSAMAGKGIGLQVGTLLATRLALPFTQRVLTTVGSGAVGVSTGSVAGPIGATAGLLVGATVGLALDFAVQQSVALMTRSAFEQTVLEAVQSTQDTFENKLLSALQDAVDVQYEDTLQLLLRF